MNSNAIFHKHWLRVSLHLLVDAAIFVVAFMFAMQVRFGIEGDEAFDVYQGFILFGGLAFACTAYIARLYSPPKSRQGTIATVLLISSALAVGVGVLLATSFIFHIQTPGRGIIFLGSGFGLAGTLIHHALFRRSFRNAAERGAFLIASEIDEREAREFRVAHDTYLEFVGAIQHGGYQIGPELPILGTSKHLEDIIRANRIARLVCSEKVLLDPAMSGRFCHLRYAGITIEPMIALCEEIDQCVPLELVTPQWLLHASGEPHILYIQKLKRLFDIVVSAIGIVLSLPILLLGILAVGLTSRGPIFYAQVRSGRFGRNFRILKLRTMRVDAEKSGVQWCGKRDPRVTPVGRFLRKYRIDEFPQLFHVFFGEMSFVGPRPERPEMIVHLAREIPFYRERLMVQPGITGWAQVNYPYGASVDDARRKLEYDLYYMKNMSLFLDVFILLDTVRIVLCGGVGESVHATRPAMFSRQGAGDGTSGDGARLDLESGVLPAPKVADSDPEMMNVADTATT